MFHKLYQEESGITALETAIILIAFVVVASVFAFTILSAGTYSTERGKEAVYAGLSEVRGSMELRGGVIAKAGATTTTSVDSLIFTLANVAGGAPVDLTANDGSNSHSVIMSYSDKSQQKKDLEWSVAFIGANDSDNLLEEGEMAEITISGLADGGGNNVLTPTLAANTIFMVEIKPAEGGVIPIERTTPASIDTVMDLR